MQPAYKSDTRRSSTASALRHQLLSQPAGEKNKSRSAAMTPTALITGATSGIRRAVANKLAQSGIHVMVVAVTWNAVKRRLLN
jgi:hypothetical protein